MKLIVVIGVLLLTAGCGGSNRFEAEARDNGRSSGSRPQASAHGPIREACLASDRKARSTRLCGCIQGVANNALSGSQQRRAVKFYSDPHLAQQTRQSDRSSDERFWLAYKAYGEEAKRHCG